ncbi:MAG: putative Lysyl endopeptidase [Chthoniobacter sp.]|nr:putative Lysyl endopeptidase [Chthoniobacter sp.]
MHALLWYFPVCLAFLASISPVDAQNEFARDFAPTITFSETRFQNVRFDSEFEFYDVVYTTASSSISARASLQGVDLATLNAETAFAFSLGDFGFEGVLGDSPNYTLGDRTITIPIDADGDETRVGNFTIRYSETEVTFTLNVNRDVQGLFSPVAYSLEGSEYEPGQYQDTLTGSFEFAGRAATDLNVYVVGPRVQIYSKTVAGGTDNEETFDALADVAVRGASDDTPPDLAFAAPAAGVKVHVSPQTVTLTSSDEHEVAAVQVQLNGGEWIDATPQAAGVWTLEAPVVKGVNTMFARARDVDGNERITGARTLTFAPLGTLTVTAAGTGAGRISASFLTPLDYAPDQPAPLRTVQIEEDEMLRLTATPAANSAFNGWTANVALTEAQAASPMLQVAFTPGLILTARFIPNPFLQLSGKFSGLVTSDQATQRGFFSSKVNAKGGFTAQVRIGREKLRVRGEFSNAGQFTGSVRKGGTFHSVTLQLATLGDGSVQLLGSVSGGGIETALAADRAVFNARTNPAPQAGTYSVSITADPANTDPNYPGAPGSGRVVVSKSGVARFAGVLGDGTRVSFGTSLSESGQWPFFALLYGKRGSISGDVQFTVAGLEGKVDWFKPATFRGPTLVAGFFGESDVAGTKLE